MTVAAVEGDVERDDVLSWYAGAMAELDATVPEPTGPPGGLYDNALFEVGRGTCWSTGRPGSPRAAAGCTR